MIKKTFFFLICSLSIPQIFTYSSNTPPFFSNMHPCTFSTSQPLSSHISNSVFHIKERQKIKVRGEEKSLLRPARSARLIPGVIHLSARSLLGCGDRRRLRNKAKAFVSSRARWHVHHPTQLGRRSARRLMRNIFTSIFCYPFTAHAQTSRDGFKGLRLGGMWPSSTVKTSNG